MGRTVKAIPDGYHSITPGFATRDGDKAIEFYKKAFGAELRGRFAGPDGSVAHCEMSIGDSVFMFGHPMDAEPYTMHVMLYVQDCDAVFDRAVKAGATVKKAIENQFYGDRGGRLTDPFGNDWFIATHVEDVSPEEMDKRMKKLMSGG